MPNLRSRRRSTFKGGEEARREAAAVEGGPEAVAGAAEVAADGGGVEAGVDAGEEDDEVFGDEIRDALVVRGEELGFGGFPGGGQCPIHRAASLEGILLAVRRLRQEESPSTFSPKGLFLKESGGNRTPVELYLDGLRGWDSEIMRKVISTLNLAARRTASVDETNAPTVAVWLAIGPASRDDLDASSSATQRI